MTTEDRAISPPAQGHCILAYQNTGAPDDAIRAYAQRVVGELAGRTGVSATLLLRESTGCWRVDADGEARRSTLAGYAVAHNARAVIVQYNPFAYGRWGLAPGLARELAALRRRSNAAVALMVHEPFVQQVGFRQVVVGAYQRSAVACVGGDG